MGSLGGEFDVISGGYCSNSADYPKVLGLTDGSYAISWVAHCSSTSITGIILSLLISYLN